MTIRSDIEQQKILIRQEQLSGEKLKGLENSLLVCEVSGRVASH